MLRWFQATHEIRVQGFGHVEWARSAWPRAGAAGEQDARLMAALDYLCGAMNRSLARAPKGDPNEELSAFRRKRRRARGHDE